MEIDLKLPQRDGLYGLEYLPDRKDKRRTEGRRACEIKQLWQRSHEIINLSLMGMSNVDIARLVGVSKECVSTTLNSEICRKKLSAMREIKDNKVLEVSQEINRLTIKAMKVYDEIFDAPVERANYKLKKETADTVALDLAGHRAPTKIDTRSMHLTATVEEIEEFKKRGIEAARAAGLLKEIKGIELEESTNA